MATAQAITPESSEPNKLGKWLQQAKDYIAELRKEMRMVTWPNREQVISTTVVVIAAIFAFAFYFAIVDFAFQSGIKKLFDTLTK